MNNKKTTVKTHIRTSKTGRKAPVRRHSRKVDSNKVGTSNNSFNDIYFVDPTFQDAIFTRSLKKAVDLFLEFWDGSEDSVNLMKLNVASLQTSLMIEGDPGDFSIVDNSVIKYIPKSKMKYVK